MGATTLYAQLLSLRFASLCIFSFFLLFRLYFSSFLSPLCLNRFLSSFSPSFPSPLSVFLDFVLFPQFVEFAAFLFCVCRIFAVVTFQIFGLKNFASIYTSNSLALALASYVFATKMAATFYNQNISTDVADNNCMGLKCFLYSYIICAALCGFAVLLALWMSRRTQLRYRQLYAPTITDLKSF